MKVNPLDEAELRVEFRRTIREVGPMQSVRIMYDLLEAVKVFSEVMLDELRQK